MRFDAARRTPCAPTGTLRFFLPQIPAFGIWAPTAGSAERWPEAGGGDGRDLAHAVRPYAAAAILPPLNPHRIRVRGKASPGFSSAQGEIFLIAGRQSHIIHIHRRNAVITIVVGSQVNRDRPPGVVMAV